MIKDLAKRYIDALAINPETDREKYNKFVTLRDSKKEIIKLLFEAIPKKITTTYHEKGVHCKLSIDKSVLSKDGVFNNYIALCQRTILSEKEFIDKMKELDYIRIKNIIGHVDTRE